MTTNITELERVGLWNHTAGKPFAQGLVDKNCLIDQLKFIIEEVTGDDELYASHRRKQENMTLDGCGDVLVTAAGVYHLLGLSCLPRLPKEATKDLSKTNTEELVDELYFMMQDLQEKIDNEAIQLNQIEYLSRQIADICVDNVVDILHIKGYDPELILQRVNDSNFTKFCTNPIDAKSSVAAYKGKNRYTHVASRKVGKYYVIRGNDKVHGVKQKILKGVHFAEPFFMDIIEKVRPDLFVEK